MKKIILLIISTLIFSSCETEIEINMPTHENKLVINSQIESNTYSSPFNNQNVLVSNSISALGSVEDYVYTDDSIPVINYALVTIDEIHKSNYEVINNYPLSFDDACYCYVNRDFIPESGKTYSLNVSAEGFPPINAIETIPSPPEYVISDFHMRSDIDNNFESHLLAYDLCELSITIKDNPNEKNYYKLKFFAGREAQNLQGLAFRQKSCWYKVADPAFLTSINRHSESDNYFEGKNGYFTDDFFNGEEKTFFIEVDKPEGAWTYFYIELSSYSENLYQFILTKKEGKVDEDNILFNNEALFIQSNIDNGYGVFGSKGVSRKAYLPLLYPTNGWLDY